MNKVQKLQHQLNQLEQEVLVLRQEKRTLEVKVSELLELSGVEDEERQWRGVTTCVETVATLPYLSSSTLLGRSGELKRLTERLSAKEENAKVGLEVPTHLRPSNFNRTKAVRVETAERWDELTTQATAKVEEGLFSVERWWNWVDDSNTLSDLEHRVSRLEKAWEHFALVSSLVEKSSTLLTALSNQPLPEEFEERLEWYLSRYFDSVAADRYREDDFEQFVELNAELALRVALQGWESNFLYAELAVKGDELKLRKLLTENGLLKTEQLTEPVAT